MTANSRPMMSATIQAGARSSCTSEMNAAEVSSLSASGSMHLAERRDLLAAPRQVAVEPVGERREREDRRADQLLAARRGSARPSNFVSSTTTSSGTRKIRVSVSEFGRFIERRDSTMITSVVVMKAILLAGGKGTRLRPLTIHTPKPIVPIFDRPFLHYQIDLLKQVPEIDEVILSLNYQPRRIEEIFGDGSDAGINIRYVVEPAPLGTGRRGALRRRVAARIGGRLQRRRADRDRSRRGHPRCTASARPGRRSC